MKERDSGKIGTLNVVLIVILIIVIVVFACGYIFLLNRDKGEGEENNNIDNTNQINEDVNQEISIPKATFYTTYFGNMIVKIGNTIYFTDEFTGLFKFDLLSKEKITLIEGRITHLNIIDNEIYYLKSVYDEDGFEAGSNLYKMNLNNKNESLIKEQIGYVQTINENEMYYTINSEEDSKQGIYKAGLNGENESAVLKGIMVEMLIQDEWIYCVEWTDKEYKHTLYKTKKDNADKSNIVYQHQVMSIGNLSVMNDGTLYITGVDYDNGEINLVKNYNGENTIISEVNGWDLRGITVLEDAIYALKGKELYKYNLDGSNMTKLVDDCESLFNIVEDYIYYCNKDYEPYLIKTDGTDKIKL